MEDKILSYLKNSKYWMQFKDKFRGLYHVHPDKIVEIIKDYEASKNTVVLDNVIGYLFNRVIEENKYRLEEENELSSREIDEAQDIVKYDMQTKIAELGFKIPDSCR